MASYIGTNGNDTLIGLDDDSDELTGKLGNDVLIGGDGKGSDWALYTHAPSAVTVNLVAGTASGGDGNDTLLGIENISGSSHNDILIGDANSNTLKGNKGNDTLIGGDGFDTVDYSDASAKVTVNLVTGVASGGDGNDVLNGIEAIIGSNFNDTLIGANGDGNTLSGGSGNDTLMGGDGGFNVLDGGSGNDSLLGGSFSNYLSGGEGNDSLVGGEGNDTLTGGLGNDILTGGNGWGRDSAYYSGASSAVVVNLANGTASGGDGSDILKGIEDIWGSFYDDTLIGDTNNNFLMGFDGKDTLVGGAGDDYLLGDAGSDSLIGGDGFDLLFGGFGNDALNGGSSDDYLSGESGNDTLVGGSGDDYLSGADGNDTLVGDDGSDRLIGGAGSDILTGGDGKGFDWADYSAASSSVTVNLATGSASGGDGNDTLSGIEGVTGSFNNDKLIGDAGHNTLEGGEGNDWLMGGLGDDALLGGKGTDWASYSDATSAVMVNLAAGTATGGAGNDFLQEIENVEGSKYNDTLKGNASDNALKGGAGNDTLDGKAGNNMLTGGAGNDIFKFTTIGHADKIIDYNVVNDTIQLENGVFTALTTTGTLAAGQFKIGAQASDANDFIIYNKSTGALLYDADANGAGDAEQIAMVGVGLDMTHADIVVI
ncbi:calcium-binding protein [uncultured Nitrosomonas sp.]|uniref:calcium-binding protein n=1 Tax=uncultured Nitrosomonas sp. TaxID=156424 RepID=UPI0025CB91E7|nr:calcium-binding protein [uncultured Nitrosomonas sp.]